MTNENSTTEPAVHERRTRRPRLERSGRRVDLGERDLELLKVLATLRVATVDSLALLLGHQFQRRTHLQHRLRELYDAGCVVRPPAQSRLRQPRRGGPPAVYALGTRGARELRGIGYPLPLSNLDQKAIALKPLSLDHRLFTSRIVAAFLAALEKTSHLVLRRILPDGEFLTHVTVPWRGRDVRLTLKPDATLLVEEDGRTTALFLEADRSTAPKERTGLEQSSFFRKVLAYSHYYADASRVLAELAADDFVVLTVTDTPKRAAALRDTACRAHPGGEGTDVFWFAAAEEVTLDDPARVLFAPIWTTASGRTGALF